MSKNYVGSAKVVTTKFGQIVNASMKLEDLQKIVNEKGYVNVSIIERKEADKFGNTHTVIENDYKPQPKNTNANEDISENLPF
jgi:hypothetical protein